MLTIRTKKSSPYHGNTVTGGAFAVPGKWFRILNLWRVRRYAPNADLVRIPWQEGHLLLLSDDKWLPLDYFYSGSLCCFQQSYMLLS